MKNVKFLILLTCLLCFNFNIQRNQINFNVLGSENTRKIEPYLSEIYVGSYTVPGVSESISLDQIVKIGILNDMNDISGDHAWKGAILAAREINEGGGILINGTEYYIGIVSENTKEFHGLTSEGENATDYMIHNHQPHFLTGGRGGAHFWSYLEIVMDHKIPFISTGDTSDKLCQNVLDDYDRYKYFFRSQPLNMTSNCINIRDHIISLAKYLNATYGGTGKNKIAILHEDSEFGNTLSTVFQIGLNLGLPNFNLTVVEDIAYPLNATLEEFEIYWNQIETAETQITLILNLATQPGVLIAKQYQAVKPRCLFFSPFNLQTQYSPYWDGTEGACQFEINFQSIHNTSKTPLTIPFFNSFIDEYGGEPYYIGIGSYDTVYLLAHAVTDAQSFNADTIVTTLEKINASNPLPGAGGNLAFTSSHDILRGYPYGYGIFCQYKYIDGTKIVIPSEEVYPNFIATDSLRLPYWGVNGLLTDPPDPPGDFNLTSTADNPDYDGKFNLSWTASVGADNYSIYMSDESITYISKNFDLFDYQTAASPFSMSLKQGKYYFRVVAYNSTGETMSFNDVHVTIPGPGPFILDSTPDKPGTDGTFDLVWTESERADNYSVYRHKSKITSINGSVTLLVNQTIVRSFLVSGLSDGKYYFAVAAFNKMGYTLSNNVDIVVPFDMTIILIVSISSVAGAASIVLVRRYLKHKGKIGAEGERREPMIVDDVTREPLKRPKTREKNNLEAKDK